MECVQEQMDKLTLLDRHVSEFHQGYRFDPLETEKRILTKRSLRSGSQGRNRHHFKPNSVAALHRLQFRAQRRDHAAPAGTRAIKSRLSVNTTWEEDEIKQHIKNHINKAGSEATPFISITTDLLRALTHAKLLQKEKDEEIYIAIIDTWELASGSFENCKTLLEHFGISDAHFYPTETLVWSELSQTSVKAVISYASLRDGIFGSIFPEIFDANTDSVESVREKLGGVRKPSLQSLAHVVAIEFQLEADALLTKYVGYILLRWCYGFTRCGVIVDLGASFWADLASIDLSLFYLDCQHRLTRASALLDLPVLQQMRPQHAVEHARAFQLPDIRSWMNVRSKQNIARFDESLLNQSSKSRLRNF